MKSVRFFLVVSLLGVAVETMSAQDTGDSSPQAASVLAPQASSPDQAAAALEEAAAVSPGESLNAPRSERRAVNRAYREEIRSMDILERPYRNVFHVYGNTVRRRHERGAIPIRNFWAQPQYLGEFDRP